MNDFNFFSSFEKAKQDQRKKNRRTKGIIIGFLGVILIFYGIMGFRIYSLNAGIQKGNDFLNDPVNKEKIAELQDKKTAIQNLKKYGAEISKAEQKIEGVNRFTSEFLDTLQKAFPGSVSLQYMGLKDNQLLLEGTAPLWTQSAELTHNLNETGLFTRVHMNSINKDKDGTTYSFSIFCDLKEVEPK